MLLLGVGFEFSGFCGCLCLNWFDGLVWVCIGGYVVLFRLGLIVAFGLVFVLLLFCFAALRFGVGFVL